MTGAAPVPGSRRRAALVVAGAAALLLLLQAALFTLCAVDGRSMEPTLAAGERLLVWRHPRSLARGDVVVFQNPLVPDELLVKRVVAVAGERVGSHEGKLVVGGFQLEEPWAMPGSALPRLDLLVPPGCLFVLGDNRAESVDSRQLGPIDRRLVVGVVLCKTWPPGGMGR